MENKKIVLLAGKGISTNIIFNALNAKFGIHLAIIEDKENTKKFLGRRIKKLGLVKVLGQILFQLMIAKPLHNFSKKRIAEIFKKNTLNDSALPIDKFKKVVSVNSIETINLLKTINPDLVIVNGTRIISKKVLQSISCKFINTHAGITPKYRGVHGTYWALVNDDIVNSGVTVHFVDEGIDTGNIIFQSQVVPEKNDNFCTYPLLQLSAGINILNNAIESYFTNSIEIKKNTGPSHLWYHPTLGQYIFYRVIKKVK